MNTPNLLHRENHEFDVCVVGGGMAGICAAIASARMGARTALIQDRAVLGGNASSEIRMWICGAHGDFNKETGILEEIQLENQYRNPTGNYSIWDSILWSKVAFQPGLCLFLNCTCTDAEMDGDTIVSVKAWQMTNQTWHRFHSRLFIDCSGDSILAAVTGAAFRSGREARSEFDEDIQPEKADRKTMGNTLLIQTRRTNEEQPFIAPPWAYKFERESDLAFRVNGVSADNFWWLELGGLRDTIRDAEPIRDELLKIGYGVWNYLKNRAPERRKAENWALEWLGSLPGKRENRRYEGDHILTCNDVRDGGQFEDVIAYGGWSMDDHHPAGILYPGVPTIFHPAPSPYGIPYRSLYSRNIGNLLFAGRNISVTHAALSSTRVMATCALLGQAAGTAAALCIRKNLKPRALGHGVELKELQTALMEADCWLPGFQLERDLLGRTARLEGSGDSLSQLLNGNERDTKNALHAWVASAGQVAEYRWAAPVHVSGVRLVFDSDLRMTKRMPCSYPYRKGVACAMPQALAKSFRIDARRPGGAWETVFRTQTNIRRLQRIPLEIEATGLRLVIDEAWGGAVARVFSFEPLATAPAGTPRYPEGESFAELRSRVDPADLIAPPQPEKKKRRRHATA